MKIFLVLKDLPFIKAGECFFYNEEKDQYIVLENGTQTIRADNCFDWIKSYFFSEDGELEDDDQWIKEIK
jgi:hypothetical protein